MRRSPPAAWPIRAHWRRWRTWSSTGRTENTRANLLETINDPADLRRLARTQLAPLADELRAYVLDSVSRTLVLVALEDEYGISLDADVLAEVRTVGQLVTRVVALVGSK